MSGFEIALTSVLAMLLLIYLGMHVGIVLALLGAAIIYLHVALRGPTS